MKNPFPRAVKEGYVFAIPLGEAGYGVGQVAKSGDWAFFDACLRALPDDVPGSLVESPIAFRVPMIKGEAKAEGWLFIGSAPLSDELRQEAVYWNQSVGSNELVLIKGNQFLPAAEKDVLGLERMAWWTGEHIKQRLLDHFAGRPNATAGFLATIKRYDPTTKQEIKN